MNRQKSFLLLASFVVLFLFVSMVALGQKSPSQPVSPAAPSGSLSSGPRIWLQANQPLPVNHVAVGLNNGQGMMAADPSVLVGLSQSQPVSMASADLDGDGLDDLIVGYSNGFISIQRGNLDAFAPQSTASFHAIERGEFPSPFVLDAKTFSVPLTPDFIALGSFSSSGNKDLAVAAKGGSTLYLFPGDGKGSFGAPQTVKVGGGITALAAGQFGSGHNDSLVVGFSGPGKNFSLAVYVATSKGFTASATYVLQAAASNIVFGDFGDAGPDVAFLSGGKVQILRSPTMKASAISLPVAVRAFALGSFIYDRNRGVQIALVAPDGSVQIAVRNEFDSRIYTQAEFSAIRQANLNRQSPPAFVPAKSFPLNGWKIAESFPGVAALGPNQAPVMFRTRASSNGADDVMVLNAFSGQLTLISHGNPKPGAQTFSAGQVSLRPYSGTPIAALPMRINVDGRPGVMAIHQGEIAPSMIMPIPDPTFTVNTTADLVSANPNACLNNVAGQCSVREAIIEANATAGTDTIMIPAGTYTLTIPRNPADHSSSATGTLEVQDSVNIIGAGQATTIIQGGTQANFSDSVDKVFSFNQDIDSFTDATVSISNFTIQNGKNAGNTIIFDGWGGAFDFDTGTSGNNTLTVTNVTLNNNTLTDGEGGGFAIFNTNDGAGSASFTNCIVQNNVIAPTSPTATANGGGGFVSVPASMTMSNCTVSGNQANSANGVNPVGGGLELLGQLGSAQTAIHNTTISGNSAGGLGGGIFDTTTLLIDQSSTISNNTAGTGGVATDTDGGGLWFDAANDSTVSKATFSGNSANASNGNGGGIFVDGSSGGALGVSFSRFAGNNAHSGSNFAVAAGGTGVVSQNNWWGTNLPAATIEDGLGSPAISHCAPGAGQICFDPFIVLTNTASPNKIGINQSSILTGDMSKDNHGNGAALAGNLNVLNGLPITFGNAVLGTIAEAQPEALNANAQATATYNAGGVGGNGSADATVDQQTVTASITILQPPSITKSFNPTTVTPNTASTITFSITNGNSVAINASFTDSLPSGLVVATPPNVVNACGGTVTATAGSGSISFANPSLAAGTCTIQVNVKSAIDNVYNNSVTINSTDAGTGNTSSASLTVISAPTIAKAFGAASIPLNGATSLTFTINNPNTNLTLNGVAFTDNLTAGLVVATPASLTNTCGGTATAVGGTSIVALSGASLAPATSCTVSVSVQGTAAGLMNNSVQVTSTNGGTGNTSNASIQVVSPPTIAKAFGAVSIPLNGITSLSFNITNPNTATTLTGIGFNDGLPGGLVISTPNGLIGSCGGGTIVALQATNLISLSGATLAPGASCTFSVSVTGIAAGTQSNTTGNVTSNEGGAGGMASATIAVVAPPVIAKAFNPTGIEPGGVSTLSITVTNPSANTVALAGVGFNDTFPANLVVATPGGLTNTCGGTAIGADGSGSVSLTGATLPVNSACTVTVNVTSSIVSTYVNTTDPVTSTNGGNGNQATANLNVALAPTISKIFVPDTVVVNNSTLLSFTINNPNSDPNPNVFLTGITFTDSLPTGLVVATPNQLSNNCGGTVTADPGSSSITLTGGSVGPAVGLASIPLGPGFGPSVGAASPGTSSSTTSTSSSKTTSTGGSKIIVRGAPALGDTASGSCFISVAVTPSVVGTLMNTTGVISANESGPGATSNTANLTVLGAPLVVAPTLAKAFGSSDIAVGQSTSLTFTVVNPNSSTELVNIGFTDAMPSGLVVTTPNGLAGTCISNFGAAITATAGSGTITLFSLNLPAASSCSFSANVTAVSGGVQNNTTGNISAVFDAGGDHFETVTGGTASASITIEAPVLAITKTHASDFHRRDHGDTYTITVSNAGAGHTLGVVTVTDILPDVNNTLIPTNLAGPGWTCTLATLTCTRNDPLNGGNSYPPITLTVNVPQNIRANVTNAATVSGGGDPNTHTAYDPTHIGPPL